MVCIGKGLPSTEDAVDSGGVEEENEDDGFEAHSSKHVLVEGRVGEGDLHVKRSTFRDLQAKTLDHCTMTMVTK